VRKEDSLSLFEGQLLTRDLRAQNAGNDDPHFIFDVVDVQRRALAVRRQGAPELEHRFFSALFTPHLEHFTGVSVLQPQRRVIDGHGFVCLVMIRAPDALGQGPIPPVPPAITSRTGAERDIVARFGVAYASFEEVCVDKLTRREVIRTGAGFAAGAAAAMTGTRLSAQGGAVNPTPPPARDPRYPLPPTWSRELKQLAPNVYAYTQGGGPDMSGPGVSNAGLIVGPDYMLAIDALQGPIPAKDFIARAQQVGGGKPIGRLVNTHHHGDHVAGNQFFTGAEISSHPYCRNEVLKAVANTPKTWTATPSVAQGGEPRVLVPPTVTFLDDVTYFLGNTEVQFRFAGPSRAWTLCVLLFACRVVAAAPSPRTLTFEERVAAQEAVDRVYYRHQVDATKPFEAVMPRASLEAKVRTVLEQSAALEAYWGTSVTDEMLQREMERMAADTRMPERLQEMFAALGNDAFLVKECLARATLVELQRRLQLPVERRQSDRHELQLRECAARLDQLVHGIDLTPLRRRPLQPDRVLRSGQLAPVAEGDPRPRRAVCPPRSDLRGWPAGLVLRSRRVRPVPGAKTVSARLPK